MNFGRAIAAARAKANLSQADLADRLDVSTGTVAAWELGADEGGHGFRMERLPKIAEALGVTVSELVERAAA